MERRRRYTFGKTDNGNLRGGKGSTAVILAIQNGDVTMAKLLLGHEDIDVDLQDKDGTKSEYFLISGQCVGRHGKQLK